MALYIDVGDVRLWGTAADMPDLFDIHILETHNWRESTSVKTSVEERAGAHGGFAPKETWRESALVSIKGHSSGSTRELYHQLTNQLNALGSNQLVRIMFEDAEERTWRDGAVVKATVSDDKASLTSTWTLDIRCPDPRRYGVAPSREELIDATNTLYNLVLNPAPVAGGAPWIASTRAEDTKAAEIVGGWARVTAPEGGAPEALWQTDPREAAKQSPGIALGVDVALARKVTYIAVDARASEARRVRLTLTWVTSGNTVIRTDAYEPVQLTAGATVRLQREVSPPANATKVRVGIDGFGQYWSPGATLEAQHAIVGVSAEYADGDSLGWVWAGQPGNSTSAKTGTSWELDNSKGTAPSTPRVEFTALSDMLDGFTLKFHGASERLYFSGAIKRGSVVKLLPAEQVVLVNGSLSEGVVVGRWPEVAAGAVVRLSLAANAPATFKAVCDWAEAWW